MSDAHCGVSVMQVHSDLSLKIKQKQKAAAAAVLLRWGQ